MSRLKPAQELSSGLGGILFEPFLEVLGNLSQRVGAAAPSGSWRLFPGCGPDLAVLPGIAETVEEGCDVRLGVIAIRGGGRIGQRGQALAENVCSCAVILNILARRRDPAPAVTILTPDALRLAIEPRADCARYDSLRRAS